MEKKTHVDELQHHGVTGMKWGVRRYQNKDGTLTAAGKKRYAKEMEKLKEQEKIAKNKAKTRAMIDKLEEKRKQVNELNNPKKKTTEDNAPKLTKEDILKSHSAELIYKNKDMFTDKEIQDAYNRLNNERNIKNMIPEKVNKGKKFVDKFTNTAKTVKNLVDASDDVIKSYNKAKTWIQSNNKDLANEQKKK